MYRQLSLHYFDAKENLKRWGCSGEFWSFKNVFATSWMFISDEHQRRWYQLPLTMRWPCQQMGQISRQTTIPTPYCFFFITWTHSCKYVLYMCICSSSCVFFVHVCLTSLVYHMQEDGWIKVCKEDVSELIHRYRKGMFWFWPLNSDQSRRLNNLSKLCKFFM